MRKLDGVLKKQNKTKTKTKKQRHHFAVHIVKAMVFPKTMTKRGPLEKGMRSHFSIVSLRTS